MLSPLKANQNNQGSLYEVPPIVDQASIDVMLLNATDCPFNENALRVKIFPLINILAI